MKRLVGISVPMSHGVKHRDQCHFAKKPDERPGGRMAFFIKGRRKPRRVRQLLAESGGL
ncbi:MAG: hypothetical protein LBT33_02320 [Spirochaetia bacterium]|nr:hypothetical protein [Spirochaetia bacterium]